MQKIKIWSGLILFSLLLLLPGISSLPVIDRDEAHFAQATRQMLQTENYFQIRFQDVTRFQKPPGINWLQAASVSLFSEPDATSIWPYRLPSILGALLSIILTLYFTRRLFDQSTALLASLLLSCSLLLIIEAHMAVIDASLLSSVVMMEGALWIIYQRHLENKKVSLFWPALFWFAMTYGLVLKGVTPLLGLLSVLSLTALNRNIRWLKNLWPLSGLLFFAVLSLTWIYLVNQAEHSNYLLQMIHKDLLPKLQGGHESHGKPPLFHLALLPLTFWPASLFLWPAGVYAWQNRRDPKVQFLLTWLLPAWIFFECMPTKLPQYVLPTFPALAILAALSIQGFSLNSSRWVKILQSLWVMLSIGLAVFLGILPYLLTQKLSVLSIMSSCVISILSIFVVYFLRRGSYQKGLATLLLLALCTYPLIFSKILPQLKPLWLSTEVANSLANAGINANQPLIAVGFDEPSLVFNLNTNMVQFKDSDEALALLQNNNKRIALIENKLFSVWSKQSDYTVLASIKGFNYSKGHWLKLLLVTPHHQES